MPESALLPCLLSLPFIGSFVAAFFRNDARNAEAWLAGLIAFAGLIIAIWLYPTIRADRLVVWQATWLPQYGLNFTLRLDGLAWAFTLLITGIGILIALYARYYMSPADPMPRFFSLLLAFMGAMLGIALSGNLVQIVFFWEITSVVSFLLIGYWHQNAAARDGARMALSLTAAGGLCLFSGVIVIGHIVGSYDLDIVLAAGDQIRSHPFYPVALVLVVIGALTKSAQFPFHFWLPQAMTAPTPVSAYLHSAAMVKAGVFLLVRLWPALGGTDYWLWLVGSAGLATFVFGAFLAIFQHDLKGLLAYSTISHLGLITLLIGLNRPLGLVAAVFHMLNHATFKASLFMAAGIIDHECGTRDIRRLSGLWHFMPITAVLAMVAAAAMAGVPLLNGFLSKEMFFAETIEVYDGSLIDAALPYIATIASTFTVAYSLRFIRDVFFGPAPKDLPRIPHEPPRWMRMPIDILVIICLVVGIVPAYTIGPILHVAVFSILGPATPDYSLAIWHGLNWPLLMSSLALLGGLVLYLLLRRYLQSERGEPNWVMQLNGRRFFDRALVTLSWRWASTAERILGTRRLQPQLVLVVLVSAAAALLALWPHDIFRLPSWPAMPDPVFAALWIVGIACAIGGASLAKFHRLAALILIGGAGLVTCITFVWLSAPDLALTQLVIEIVTLTLLLLGLRWLPKRASEQGESPPSLSTWLRRIRDFSIAIGTGAGLALLAYAGMTGPAPDTIAKEFLARAYLEGGGTNVVNVILVDFRGFDTFGEITVLGVVAITVYALLRRFRPAADSIEVPEQQRQQEALQADGKASDDYLAAPSAIMQLLFPFIAVVAAYFLLRGHDLPGGGFVGGTVMAIALLLQYIASGSRFVEANLRIRPLRWISLGLLTALCAGLGAFAFSRPFLTSAFSYADIPLIGAVPMASALIFDLGVFSLVVGTIALILIALAHQSIRSHRATGTPLQGESREEP